MKSVLNICFIFVFFLSASLLNSNLLNADTQKSELQPDSSNNILILKGKVTVKGAAPHSYLSLTAEDRNEYKLVGNHADYIRANLQQQVVKLQGTIVKEAIGPGLPAEFEVIKILLDPILGD